MDHSTIVIMLAIALRPITSFNSGHCVMLMCVVREEEEYDHRSLYERLKSQKDKAEADKAEQFKFSEFLVY